MFFFDFSSAHFELLKVAKTNFDKTPFIKLQMSLISCIRHIWCYLGYPYVLPDMIGGNGYSSDHPNDESTPPSKELYIRWLQANVFMPGMQFSFVPWQYDAEV